MRNIIFCFYSRFFLALLFDIYRNMTNGIGTQPDYQGRHRRLSIRTMPLKIVKPDDDHTHQHDETSSESEPSPKGTPENVPKPPLLSSLTRQVSHDGLANSSDADIEKKRPASDSVQASPYHSDDAEFDHDTTALSDDPQMKYIPPQPNPLHNPSLFRRHTQSLRLEAHLHPMRLILSRLMTHLNYNRKGIFNTPVDPISLGLSDYFTVIKKPMDLGTVKNRLHSVAYQSRRACADDIRLCLRNAMLYNPPQNTIHIAAKELLRYFEDQLSSFCPELADFELLEATNSEFSLVRMDEDTGAKDIEESFHDTDFQHQENSNEVGKTPASLSAAHHFSTRNSSPDEISISVNSKKRKKRGSKINSAHSCQWCNGNVCTVCDQGCLSLQPSLLICNGPHCIGAKIRKGTTYFIAPDGSCQFCQRCFVGLPAILPGKHEDLDLCCYKRNLLKRKNDEESVEHWLTCSQCESTVHRMCVMYNPYVHSTQNFICPSCHSRNDDSVIADVQEIQQQSSVERKDESMYTFIVGEDFPIPMSDIITSPHEGKYLGLCADLLPENAISQFIEEKVRQKMFSSDCPNAEKTIIVRMISDCERYFKVPEVIRKHFRLQTLGNKAGISPPLKVMYRSKAIALFQKFDGLDVCIFCMYVHEYDGNDEFDNERDKLLVVQEKRVYIAYLDSVEHFRPRTLRTAVYQEVLTAYLATARLRGYEAAHIWACPPSRGNSFVFWNHPSAQRTPNVERLTSWYHAALSRAIDCGVITNVQSLYESNFEEPLRLVEENTYSRVCTGLKMPCPPLLEGDFWIEEALRVYNTTFTRLLKENSNPVGELLLRSDDTSTSTNCPAIHIAAMFREKVINLPISKAFRRPVNAAAMKLSDYHTIITKPMDLGTVLSRCILGEYDTLLDMVNDVRLVFSNAKKFNPPGHIVHVNAIELEEIFMTELTAISKTWIEPKPGGSMQHSLEGFNTISMSLCETHPNKATPEIVTDDNAASVELQKVLVSGKCSESFVEVQSSANGNELFDGPDFVRHSMVGEDVWLLEKKTVPPPKIVGLSKSTKRGRKSGIDIADEPASKRRRQTWLGEEVGTAVRRMRTSFFKCTLNNHTAECGTELMAANEFRAYIADYKDGGREESRISSRVADARHSFLEVSQFRGLEFDTLRRAKYSSAVLLYHLHHDGAPGLIPECTTCGKEIEGVRWHRMCKVVENRPPCITLHTTGRKPKAATPFQMEEICPTCFSGKSDQHQFIPLQVSI